MKHLARKRFGQHFLTDVMVLGAIVDGLSPTEKHTGGVMFFGSNLPG